MKRIKIPSQVLFSVTLFAAAISLSFGSFAQDYFQQEVDYRIEVKLDDKAHLLHAYEEFDYTNNSTATLDFMYVHLWPNAYKNKHTALGKQLYSMDDMSLETATDEEKGYIDSLNFKVNEADVSWELDPQHIDICKIIFNSPLKPGEKITVSTPFRVKIPSGSISRLGHIEESYQITQWYPKPAVYDQGGWQQMPYLTQGEFYSEFGTFDVSITLPKNYVVGATGDLETESELAFLNKLAEKTEKKFLEDEFDGSSVETSFPSSSDEFKTIRYTQSNVHDFAWFADKRFEVLKGEVELPHSSRKVTSWAMFVPHHAAVWKDAIEYINDGTFYYSKWNGDYPYNNVTAVDGTISAGGGMEYPNVTVIGESGTKMELELVIVHEVGHNWFYGLLGSNERRHAWMDEGLNTLNEMRYFMTKYPDNDYFSDMFGGMGDKVHLGGLSHYKMSYYAYAMVAGYGLDQPVELDADEYYPINYGSIVYSKTGLIFMYLKDYLGEEKFDEIMQRYFDEWHYKHPQPNDLRRLFEEGTNKDLSWFFEDLIQTTKQIDYKIAKVSMENGQTTVCVKNTGQVNGPIRVDAIKSKKIVASKWVEPTAEIKEVVFEGEAFDEIVLDKNQIIPDVNPNNNYWDKSQSFKRIEPLKIEYIGGDNEAEKWNMGWTPIIGANVYDQFMVGIMLHNISVPKNKFEYTLAPMFSFGQLGLSGFGDMNYTWVPAKNLRTVSLGLEAKKFGQGITEILDDFNEVQTGNYWLLRPYLDLAIGKPYKRKNIQQNISLKGHYVQESGSTYESELTGGSFNYNFAFKKRRHKVEAEIQADYFNTTTTRVFDTYASDLLNASATVKYSLTYWEAKKKSVKLRAFFGQNIFYNGVNNPRYGFNLGGQNGWQDATYQNYMFGRNRTDGLWANQRIENQGGFKTVSNYGNSTTMLAAANLIADLPFIPLISIYADYGVFDNYGTLRSAADAGIAIQVQDILGIYFPLYESNDLFESYEPGTTYWNKIRFTLSMEGLAPRKIAPKLVF
jgi:hypothetical protein